MRRRLVLATFIVMMPMVTDTLGQAVHPPVVQPGIMDPPENRGHFDRLPVPLDQTADVIVVLIPDETFHLLAPTPYERVVRGTIARLDKGPVPKMIVHTPNTIVTSLQVGVPAKLFLKKFKDRDAYYIIGVVPGPEGEKP